MNKKSRDSYPLIKQVLNTTLVKKRSRELIILQTEMNGVQYLTVTNSSKKLSRTSEFYSDKKLIVAENKAPF